LLLQLQQQAAAVAAAAPAMQNAEQKTAGVSSKPCQKTMWPIFMLLAAGLLLVAAMLVHSSLSDPGDAQPRRLAAGGPELGEPALIGFASNPDKCWKVPGPKTSVSNGLAVAIWDCQHADKFLVPLSGSGMIRLERDDQFCLNAPGGAHTLQIWQCNGAPNTNVRFELPTPPNKGVIRRSGDSTCVDLPSGDTTNGRKVQQWDCDDPRATINLQWIVKATSRCIWDNWEDWTDDCRFCKKRRVRRYVPHEDFGLDASCHAQETEVVGCETPECEGKSSGGHNAEAKNETLMA